MTIEALRTPEGRFVVLLNFPYEPHYVERLPDYEGLRMHYIDEGPANATDTIFVCMASRPGSICAAK